jgi:hypothetical protein
MSKKQSDLFSNIIVTTFDPMDSDDRNAVTETGGKRAEVTPPASVEPGISVKSGISTFLCKFIALHVLR